MIGIQNARPTDPWAQAEVTKSLSNPSNRLKSSSISSLKDMKLEQDSQPQIAEFRRLFQVVEVLNLRTGSRATASLQTTTNAGT